VGRYGETVADRRRRIDAGLARSDTQNITGNDTGAGATIAGHQEVRTLP